MRCTPLPAVLAAAALLAACSDVAPLPHPGGADAALAPLHQVLRPIPGSYVVVLKEGFAPREVAARSGVTPAYVYDGALRGFAARLTPRQLFALRRGGAVAYVEPDQVAQPEGTQSNAPWHLDRIDQRRLPLDSRYAYPSPAGAGVYAYVIDSGIDTSHPEFGSRATNVYDAFGGSGQDCNGHGSHVAGTIGSTTYGVAKGVQLRGVKVLDCRGAGSTSAIIAAVEWVRLNAQRPAVANLSLSVGASPALDAAVDSLAASGIFVAAAAGDGNASACTVSPAAAAGAFTVAASTRADARWTGSNWGPCVDAYAPGVDVRSTSPGGGTALLTGTSSSAAIVTGIAALYKSVHGESSTVAIDSWIRPAATVGIVTGNPTGTPNLLVYVGIDTWI